MNLFDSTIIGWFGRVSQQSWAFDQLVRFLAGSELAKGGVLTALIWWAWFRRDVRPVERRARIASTLLGCVVAVAVARAIALLAPFRVRPLQQEGLNFRIPIGQSPVDYIGWSSFPSDHAALFFALATGLLFVSRRVGVLALVYTTVFVALPRIYLGVHYPTDILAGAAIGMAVAWASNVWLPRTGLLKWIMHVAMQQPARFYPVFFLLTFQIAELFNSSREVLVNAYALIAHAGLHH
jgi:undecaprenyl-diphosphatase